jgi:hypothetical protein
MNGVAYYGVARQHFTGFFFEYNIHKDCTMNLRSPTSVATAKKGHS